MQNLSPLDDRRSHSYRRIVVGTVVGTALLIEFVGAIGYPFVTRGAATCNDDYIAAVQTAWADLAKQPGFESLSAETEAWCDEDDPQPAMGIEPSAPKGTTKDELLDNYIAALTRLGWTEKEYYPVGLVSPDSPGPSNLCAELRQGERVLTARLDLSKDDSEISEFAIRADKNSGC